MGITTKRFLEQKDAPDVELQYPPVQGTEILQGEAHGQLVLGYLTDDSFACNPLEDGEGFGSIFSSHRHATKDQHEGMQAALGLDREWNLNLEWIWERHTAEALNRYTQRVLETHDMAELVAEFAETYTRDEGETDADFATACLRQDATDQAWDNVPFWEDLENVLTKMHQDPAFSPRNPDAIPLDCYEHSGQVWSISGGGMQCQFDTSRGAGVWVPDDSARDEIDRRAPIYAHYWIENTNWLRGTGNKYLLHGPDTAKFGADWDELFTLAEDLSKQQPPPTPEQLTQGRQRAAQEIAKNALDEYNAWLAGECYGIVIQTHEKETAKLIEQDVTWNLIGSDAAQTTLQQDFDSTLKHIQECDVTA